MKPNINQVGTNSTNEGRKLNLTVVTGVFLCVATVAMIVVLNISARRTPSIPQRAISTEIKLPKTNSHYSKYVHAGYTTALR